MFVKKRAARKGWVFAMKKKTLYIVTGAAGHLGGTIVRLLHKRRLPVRGFLRLGETPPVAGVPYVYGDVRDADSLRPLFADVMEERVVVIHTAGIVGIADAPDPVMHDVNVNGTSIVASLCLEYGARMVYVSSVHAIPENGGLRVLTETDSFSPDTVQGWYAKSKAEATRNVLAAVREKGLDTVVVHPSGIIGPFTEDNHLVQLIGDYIDGSLPACVRGGYDFVDVRDVAAGCIAAADKGRRGECYILSNRHYEVRELLEIARRCGGGRRLPVLPAWLAKAAVPVIGLYARISHRRPLYTAYSIDTLQSNDRFSHDKATAELGFFPRDICRTVADTIAWLRRRRVKA